jgi:hypothetical protein
MMQLFGSREDFIRIHHEIQHLDDFEDENHKEGLRPDRF